MESANKMNADSEATWQVWFSSQRLSEESSKFNLSGDASAGYDWKTPSGNGQGSQRTGRGNSEAVRRKRSIARQRSRSNGMGKSC